MTCETCNGTGEIITQENQAPLGSGMVWLEDISDDCPDCTSSGLCPQCDKEWSEDNIETYLDCVSGVNKFAGGEFSCPYCNWTWGEV